VFVYNRYFCKRVLNMYMCSIPSRVKGKLSNIDATRDQFCAIDDLSGFSIIRFDNSFKQWNLTVTGITIKSYQITSIMVIFPQE